MVCFEILDGDSRSAKENMELDKRLLDRMHAGSNPVLHIHRWRAPCATYGYFFPIGRHIKSLSNASSKLEIAKRPTGGGMVFHAFDISFALILPLTFPRISEVTLNNYHLINSAALRAVKRFLSLKGQEKLLLSLLEKEEDAQGQVEGFCMAKPTIYDVILPDGRKVVGAAQRRTKQGLLHQGTLSLRLPPKKVICDTLSAGDKVYEAMRRATFAVMSEAGVSEPELKKEKERLIALLKQEIKALAAT